VQGSPGEHCSPQPPQLRGSVSVLVQVPLQFVIPRKQVPAAGFCATATGCRHEPAEHSWPKLQACPQEPQFFGSVLVLVQPVLAQMACPAGQETCWRTGTAVVLTGRMLTLLRIVSVGVTFGWKQ